MILIAVLCWSGSALVRRLVSTWHFAHNIQGFVAYGVHESRFSPDADRIVIESGKRSKVVELAGGRFLASLEGYAGQGLSDFSSDGTIISRFSKDVTTASMATLWNASNGRVVGWLHAPPDEDLTTCSPVFSPDGKLIAGAFAKGLLIWNSIGLKQIAQITIRWPKDEWLPRLLAWNPANQELTVVDEDGKLLRIDIAQEAAIPVGFEPSTPVQFAGWSPDGTRLLTINREDGSVSIWDGKTAKMVAKIPETGTITASFSPTGQEVVTSKRRRDVVRRVMKAPSFWDRTTRVWNAATGTLEHDLPTIGIVTFSPDWRYRVETGPEGLRVARFDGSEAYECPSWFDGHGSTSAFAPDNRYVASVNGSGRVAIWRHRDPTRDWLDCLSGHEFWVCVVTLVALAWTFLSRSCVKASTANVGR